MTTATTAPAPVERPTRSRSRRPRTYHYFHHDALEFARSAGLQARAVCGVWINPNVPGTAAEVGTSSEFRICGNCARIRESRLRHMTA